MRIFQGRMNFKKNKSSNCRQTSRTESIYTLRRTVIPSTPNLWFRFFLFIFRQKAVSENVNVFDTNEDCSIIIPNHVIYQQEEQQRQEQKKVSEPDQDHDQDPDPDQGKGQNQDQDQDQSHQLEKHPQLYNSNKIRTTKYTFLSFLPKNLLEQFHRIANLYFLFIVLLNWYPAIRAFGKEIAIIPIGFVLGVTAIKDLFEDRRRHDSDKRINNTLCRVYNRLVSPFFQRNLT